MTYAPTPEQFLAAPSAPEDDELDGFAAPHTDNTAHLASIADSLRRLIGIVEEHAAEEKANSQAEARYDELDKAYAELEADRDDKQALLDRVLAICKPSVSKLANEIRAALMPPAEPEEPGGEDEAVETPPEMSCVKRLGDANCDQFEHAIDPESGRPIHSGIAPGGNRVYWTADGEPHNHDFRTGEAPNTCACGVALPA